MWPDYHKLLFVDTEILGSWKTDKTNIYFQYWIPETKLLPQYSQVMNISKFKSLPHLKSFINVVSSREKLKEYKFKLSEAMNALKWIRKILIWRSESDYSQHGDVGTRYGKQLVEQSKQEIVKANIFINNIKESLEWNIIVFIEESRCLDMYMLCYGRLLTPLKYSLRKYFSPCLVEMELYSSEELVISVRI